MSKYSEYMQSQEWMDLKKLVKYQRGHFCGLCGYTEHLECHHLIYKNLYDCVPEDIIILCKACHNIVHDVFEHKDFRGLTAIEAKEKLLTTLKNHLDFNFETQAKRLRQRKRKRDKFLKKYPHISKEEVDRYFPSDDYL